MIKALLFFLVLFLPVRVAAQFIFQNLKTADGLSAKQVRCLYKDTQGYLWIGTTKGLNRFDGAIVQAYPGIPGENALFINAIHPLSAETDLLIGTTKGLIIFNRQTGTYRHDPRFAVLERETILTIKPDGSNRLWIVTTSKLFILNQGKLLPAEQVIPETNLIHSQLFTVSAFVWDQRRQGFWVGGTRTYFIDCQQNRVYHQTNNPQQNPLLNQAGIYSIALDQNGNLWYGCNHNPALRLWDHRTGKVDFFSELDGTKLLESPNQLFVDTQNRLWVSTRLFAAYLKEPGQPFRKIPYSQDQPYSIGYGFFRDVLEDPDGNIWLATINGVSKSSSRAPLQAIYQLPSFDFFLETGFAHINSVSLHEDVIMACKADGIIAYQMSKRTFQHYTVPGFKNKISNNFNMAVRSPDRWWFAGDDGVFYLKPGASVLTRFTQIRTGASMKYAHFIFSDQEGRIWFTIWGDALYRYNPKTNQCDRFDGRDARHGLFQYRNCQNFVKLRNGNLLFTQKGTGFLYFNAKTEQFSTIPVPNPDEFYTTGAVEDKMGAIWAAVENKGLLKISIAGMYLDSVRTGKGLPFDLIQALAQDDRGMIWTATREGLSFMNPHTKAITRVAVDLGKNLQDYWNNVTVYNGKVFAVMLDHVVVLDPARFAATPVKKPPHITSLKVLGQEVTGILNRQPNLELESFQNYLTFQFASLKHLDVPSLQYSYQLEGIDRNWILAGRTLQASYTNLPPGSYTFNVRSTDENGRWMAAVGKLPLYIKPPWWQTGWFFTSLSALFVLLAGLWYRNDRQRRHKRRVDQTIEYFAHSVYSDNSIDAICRDIAHNCVLQLHFENCAVYLRNMENQRLIQKAVYGSDPKYYPPVDFESLQNRSELAVATEKPLLIRNTAKSTGYDQQDSENQSLISVPITHEGKVIGLIVSQHRKKNFFNADHLRALSTISSISAVKIAEALASEFARQNEIKLLEIDKMLAESQMIALRAQINPHFVFNCLTSIQECIITRKYEEANKYLIKFARLFRLILSNSSKTLITIREEEEVLELYLQLEQMRFDQTFSYQIIRENELKADEILIPSMLLQPYVENAIWHGLMQKTGERQLVVTFRLVNEGQLQCWIDDNGIGRQKSAELNRNKSKAPGFESKGMALSKDRLELLSRQGQQASVTIVDKYDAAGNPAGTRVIIELSVLLKSFYLA